MKTLTIEQMEDLKGGSPCGKIGAIFGIAAGILGVVALATNPITLAGALVLAHSISFSMVATGCGLAEILE